MGPTNWALPGDHSQGLFWHFRLAKTGGARWPFKLSPFLRREKIENKGKEGEEKDLFLPFLPP